MNTLDRTWEAAALVVAAVGIGIQIAAGVDYPAVPPGLVILVVAAVLVAVVARTWALVVGAVVALFILVGGLFADPGWGELTDGSGGEVLGTVVELVGLVAALVIGVLLVRPRGAIR